MVSHALEERGNLAAGASADAGAGTAMDAATTAGA
jgi:hypothetical protein